MTSKTILRAERDTVDQVITFLEPLIDGIWLATDLRTLVHWTIPIDAVTPVVEDEDGAPCFRAFGLVTLCAAEQEPVFLFNDRDLLEWEEPDQILAVRELGDPACEIRLERLDDRDARLVDPVNYLPHDNEFQVHHLLPVGNSGYLEIYDEQLPTGCPAADDRLRMIEATINARRRLIGPAAGTLDVMRLMATELHETARFCDMRSFIWAAVLSEQIEQMCQQLAA